MIGKEDPATQADLRSTRPFVLASIAIAVIVTLALSSVSLLQANPAELDISLASLRLLSGIGLLLTAIASLLHASRRNIYAAISSFSLVILINLNTTEARSTLIDIWHFTAFAIAQTIFTYSFLRATLSLLRLSAAWLERPPLIASFVLASIALFGFVSQNLVEIATTSSWLAFASTLMLVCVPGVVLFASASYPPLRLDHKDWRNSIKLRLPSIQAERPAALTFQLCLLGSTLNVVLYGRSWATSEPSPIILDGFQLAWLGLLYLSISELVAYARNSSHAGLLERLTNNSTRRFLGRQFYHRANWAATIGLKTTNFSIDHDPQGDLAEQLPASIMQLRTEEIRRCIMDILGPLQLHSQQLGEQIIGAIDPEIAKRPCVDTLKMFATLYLDAAPLVERRIKGLASLLPIIDPSMVQVLQPKDLDNLFRRNSWFFYFDFTWIDQYMIDAPRGARYDVRMNTLAPQTRLAIFEHMARGGSLANYVWLGPTARDRLIQEAPFLSNIIEACPIPARNSQDEHLIFVIRFEQLIPRLQRYFDLDSMRKAILDFEPNADTIRLSQVLSLQIANAPSTQAMLDAIGSIGSYSWRGFKEKDQALQLLLTAYKVLSSTKFAGTPLHQATAPTYEEAYRMILKTIREIGYPSQIMHDAQQKKINFRNVDLLCEAAADTRNPRFHEAWLLLSVTDFGRCSAAQRQKAFNLLLHLDHHTKLMKLNIVQAKCLDVLANLGRTAQAQDSQILTELINRTARWFIQKQVDPDILCLFLDIYVFLKFDGHCDVNLSIDLAEDIEHHVRSLTFGAHRSHPILKALQSRWQEIRSVMLALEFDDQGLATTDDAYPRNHQKAG